MKNKTRKITTALIASVLAFGMMAGCAGSNSSKEESKSPSPESAPDTTVSTTDIEDGKVYNIGVCQLVQHQALDAATQGFQDCLTKLMGKEHVKFDVQNAQNDSPTCATICNQFVSSNYDLIMANATASLQAASTATTDIPILATSITDYGTALDMKDFSGTTGKNVSGTSDLAPLKEQANIIKELCPDAKNVGILYCSAEPNSKFQSDSITTSLEELGYSVKEFTFSDSNDVAQVTTNACNESDVIYIPTDNTAASNAELIDNIARPAKKPIIAGEENICKGCGVATLSISYYDLWYKTGEMAYDVLVNGKDIASMKIEYSPSTTKEYIADRASELGISIPDGYTEIKAD